MTTAEKMKNRRKLLDMTVREFAEAMGVSESTVRSWENGSRNPLGPNWKLSNFLLIEANKV